MYMIVQIISQGALYMAIHVHVHMLIDLDLIIIIHVALAWNDTPRD